MTTSVPRTQISRDTWQYVAGPPPPPYTETYVQDDNSVAFGDRNNGNQGPNLSTLDNAVELTSTELNTDTQREAGFEPQVVDSTSDSHSNSLLV